MVAKKSSKKSAGTGTAPAAAATRERKPRGESSKKNLGVALAVLFRAVQGYLGAPEGDTPENVDIGAQLRLKQAAAMTGAAATLKAEGFENYRTPADLQAEIEAQIKALDLKVPANLDKLAELTKALKKAQK